MSTKNSKNKYKDTLNLPHTDFSIRANAYNKEPELLKKWDEDGVHEKVSKRGKTGETFIVFDGPPYANGHIHMGTAANKTLKDIVAKSRRMAGYYVPFKPGWDCHGLPIEQKVIGEKKDVDPQVIKKACRKFANKWIDIQRKEFKNIGILGDWENPYITMDPSYEASIVRSFSRFIKDGYIERKNKTVPWCSTCRTVLATAEIEYQDRKDPSIYIFFPVEIEDGKKLFAKAYKKYSDLDVGFLIWTTTPWTIPLNRAVVLNPSSHYVLLKGRGSKKAYIIGKDLVDTLCDILELKKEVLGEVHSKDFLGVHVCHPFIEDLNVPVLLDHSVTLNEGTACMHMAPGCGPEDYTLGVQNNIEIFSPLSPDGKYTEGIEPKELEGMSIEDGQIWVIKKLAATETLECKTSVRHSYPHCWRCRKGLMFRATKQWFCNLQKNDLVNAALKEIERVGFVPETGRARLSSTVGNRTEWCISRQRNWGVPIPALHCTECETSFLDAGFVEKVADGVQKDGVEYWDKIAVDEMITNNLLPRNFACKQCKNSDLKKFKKEHDILDVWFDSGVAHYAVAQEDDRFVGTADVYIEGSDQHRGWFQSSLLVSMILQKHSPTKAIVTHGYVVDGKGHKMSKSIGNVIAPEEIIKQYSRDILRLWVASVDYQGDMVVSQDILKTVSEVYRKIRNTCRFLLANLYDFDIKKDAIAIEDMEIVDQYGMHLLYKCVGQMRTAYDQYDINSAFRVLNTFCTTTLSAFYLDVIKDRLYVEKPDGKLRQSAQTVCYHILDALTTHMAPVLSFLAEDIFENYSKNKESIHLQTFTDVVDVSEHIDHNDWEDLLWLRSVILRALEEKRSEGVIGHSLDAKVAIYLDTKEKNAKRIHDFFKKLDKDNIERFFKDLFIVSHVTFAPKASGLNKTDVPGIFVSIDHADGDKCLRCWQWEAEGYNDDLCYRCKKIIG
jgi:isoleucyl-tRNA synthetase